jgi:flagellar protein FlgJ
MGGSAMTGAVNVVGGAAATPAAIPRPGGAGASGSRKSAEDFTSFFLSQSLESMYAGVAADPLFGGGSSEQMFRSMMVQEYGKAMARSSTGLGIVDAVQREIIHLQEVAK